MALTPSNMLELGTKAPSFVLRDVMSDNDLSFEDIKGKNGTLVMFLCVHCPYVIHVQDEIAKIAIQYKERGLGVVGISSNDIDAYPQDAPEFMKLQGKEAGFNFPYLFDNTQKIAKDYDAACTPDFYLFDSDSTLVYRGRLDESRPNNEIEVDGRDLRGAIDLLINRKTQNKLQYPSMGCNIKWKS